ncbi:MAG TPA: glycosyltransferase [Longimicrobiales bacterium]|nr:glycosyltransferase [Longimicrobiales bacterium]
MRVLINFLPLLGRGGGRQNAMNLWAALARHGGAGHRWLAVCRSNLALPDPPVGSGMEVAILPVEGAGLGGGRFRAENLELPRLARRFGAELIFTPMGTGPLHSGVPRVAGWHDGTAVYPESPMWVGLPTAELLAQRLRTAYAAAALRGAARVCVQTSTMGRRVSAVLGVPPERIRVVPNGLSSFLAGEAPAGEGPGIGDAGSGGAWLAPRRVLVVTTTMPAKNLPALPRIARALAALGVDGVEIVATLTPEAGAREMGLEPPPAAASSVGAHGGGGGPDGGVVVPGAVPVRCIGGVPHERLGDLYRSGSAVLVPSWVESFTAVYPEAWHFGLPVVTSDLDFARDLCGKAALYAPPARPDAFALQLLRALTDDPLRRALDLAGRVRLAALPDWDRRLELYLAALDEATAMG